MKDLPDFNLPLAIDLLEQHNAILLDIRTHPEFCQGHLAGAIFIPTPLPPLTNREEQVLQDQLWYKLRNVPHNHPIVLYCKKGIRAKIAKKILKGLGFRYVTALGGVQETPLKEIFSAKNPIWPVCFCSKTK